MEVALTQIFDRPLPGSELFEVDADADERRFALQRVEFLAHAADGVGEVALYFPAGFEFAETGFSQDAVNFDLGEALGVIGAEGVLGSESRRPRKGQRLHD